MIEITGEKTGRRWTYHPTIDRIEANGYGHRWIVTDVGNGSLAYYHQYPKEELYADDVERMRTAIEVARLPQVACSRVIVKLLDTFETPTTAGEFGYPGLLGTVWELADAMTLRDLLRESAEQRLSAAAEIESNLREAIEVLHDVGWIHSDVAPNNVLRVNGVWKLADLDSCTRRGTPVKRMPGLQRYAHPKLRLGGEVHVASDDLDQWGLCEIVRALHGE